MKHLRGFKYRFYPTSAQRLELAQTFGCTRYVYNWALALRTNSYYQDNVSLSYTDTSNALTKLKKNIGAIDRVIRIAIAGGLLYLGLVVYRGSAIGIELAIVSIIPLVTAWLGNCPLYNLLGISTHKANPNFRSK